MRGLPLPAPAKMMGAYPEDGGVMNAKVRLRRIRGADKCKGKPVSII